MSGSDLVIRNARDRTGRPISAVLTDGHIAALGECVEGSGTEIDAQGRMLRPGFHDHHIHLLATAARLDSVDLAACGSRDAIIAAIGAKGTAPGGWIRAVGYDERAAGLPDRHDLDLWAPANPLRVQDRTGALWLFNSAALALLGDAALPDAVERDAAGRPTGRIWRGDAWLRTRFGGTTPDLAALGRQLARCGVTAVTDAGATNGAPEAALLAGSIPQRLTLMGTEFLTEGSGYALGPLKLLFDESDLPPLETAAARVDFARKGGRNIAAHCVTLGELLFFLELLRVTGGARPGDRIEHGGVIIESLIGDIATAGLTVVTQPNFIHDRGDRYREQIPAAELGDLYRLGSLQRGGIEVRGGSDAPYGAIDPWVAIRAATDRRTLSGAVVGGDEAVSREAALALYSPAALRIGDPADLILYDWPDEAGSLGAVSLTVIGGNIAWSDG